MSPKLTFQEVSDLVGENRETKLDITGTKYADTFGAQRPGERCRGQRSFCPTFPIPSKPFNRKMKEENHPGKLELVRLSFYCLEIRLPQSWRQRKRRRRVTVRFGAGAAYQASATGGRRLVIDAGNQFPAAGDFKIPTLPESANSSSGVRV